MGKFTATSSSGYVATNLQNQGASENDWVKYQVSTKDKSALTIDSSTTATSLVTSTEIKPYEQIGLYNSTDGFKIMTLGSVSYDSGTGLYTTDITSAGLTTAPTKAHTLTKRNDLTLDSSASSTSLVATASIENTEAIIDGEDLVVYNSTDGYKKVSSVTPTKSISGSNILYTVDISSASLTTAPTLAYTIRPRVLVSTGSSNNIANVDDIVLDVDTGNSDTTSIVTNYATVSLDERYRIKNATKIDTDTNTDITPSAVSETYNDPTSTDPFSDSSEKAFYRFEDDLTDEEGSYNGGLLGSVTYNTGKFSKCMTPATGTYQGMETSALGGLTNFSVSLWVKEQANGNPTYFSFVKSGERSFQFIYNTDRWYLYMSSDGSSWDIANGVTIIGDGITQGQWEHVVVTRNGTTAKIYVDNVLIGSATLSSSSAINSSQNTCFGNYDSSSNNVVDGIDQLRVFNKELTSSEVEQLYFEGQSKYDITIPTQSAASTKAVVRPSNIDVLSIDTSNTSYDSANDIVEMKYDAENKDPSTFSCVQVKWQAQRSGDENSKIQVDLWKT